MENCKLTDNSILEDLLLSFQQGELVIENIESELKKDKVFLVPIMQCIKTKENASQIQFIFEEKNEGAYILIFTSENALATGLDGHKFILLSFNEILSLLKTENSIVGIIINPFTSNYRVSDKMTNKVNGNKILIGEPMEYPTHLLGLLVGIFEQKIYNVNKAWIAVLQQGYNTLELLLVLDGDYNEEELYEIIRKKAITMLQDVGMAITNNHNVYGVKVSNSFPAFWDKESGINKNLF